LCLSSQPGLPGTPITPLFSCLSPLTVSLSCQTRKHCCSRSYASSTCRKRRNDSTANWCWFAVRPASANSWVTVHRDSRPESKVAIIVPLPSNSSTLLSVPPSSSVARGLAPRSFAGALLPLEPTTARQTMPTGLAERRPVCGPAMPLSANAQSHANVRFTNSASAADYSSLTTPCARATLRMLCASGRSLPASSTMPPRNHDSLLGTAGISEASAPPAEVSPTASVCPCLASSMPICSTSCRTS